MNTQIVFRSDKFPAYDNEEDQINPGQWGKRLAEYVRDKLPQYGFKVARMVPEDWGWDVEIENERFGMWIGCGHRTNDDTEFLCCIEPSKPSIRRWFKKIDTTEQVGRLSDALWKIFGSDPDIRDLHWESDDV